MSGNNITCSQSTETLENVISIIDLSVSICMLIIGIIGVICVYSYRKHQKEAVYGFYINIKTFLAAFQLYTHSGTNLPVDWMHILGKKKEDISEEERATIKPITDICSIFYKFLSTTSNQIPPSRKTKEIKKWNSAFDNLRGRLVEIINYDLQAYPNWGENKIQETYTNLNQSISDILELIKIYS